MKERSKGHGTGANQHTELELRPTTQAPPRLKELGITRDEASKWQKLGAQNRIAGATVLPAG
jgi:hypothetical protein